MWETYVMNESDANDVVACGRLFNSRIYTKTDYYNNHIGEYDIFWWRSKDVEIGCRMGFYKQGNFKFVGHKDSTAQKYAEKKINFELIK